MRRETLGAPAALVVALAVLASGCGGGERAIRIGVLTDCQGPLSGFQDAMLAGAELPFVRRGGRLRGPSPVDGVTPIHIAGRRVELVQGCAESGEHTVFIEEARRLVEKQHVDAVVGGASVVTRDVARRYPDVPFVETFWDDPDTTLRHPATNLYRFTLDASQRVAGLGAYAYRRLGWRRVALVTGGAPDGWAAAAGFTAEFCALGGHVVREVYGSPLQPRQDVGAEAAAGHPDGVVQLMGPFDGVAAATGTILSHLRGSPARHLLLSSLALEDPQFVQAYGRRLDGVVATSFIPAGAPDTALRSYRTAFARAYPGLPPAMADASTVLGYHDSIEAILRALDRVHGDPGAHRRRLERSLAGLTLRLPRGTVRLDGNRQAITDVPIVRLGPEPGALRPVTTAKGVEQGFGGLLAKAPPPGPHTQPCVRATPPPWASG